MRDSVRFWIDGSVQPVLLTVDSDRLLIDRNAIRDLTANWLSVRFSHSVVNSNLTSIDTQILKKNNCI